MNRLLVIFCIVSLTGCVTEPLSPKLRAAPERVELSGVPFFAQNAFQSAPASMAALLTQQGEVVTPGMIEHELQLPQKQALLPESLKGTAHRRGLLMYPMDNRLDDLLEQVAAGNPVLVALREGLGWTDRRYALLIGYDRVSRQVLLRHAHERRAQMSFSSFQSSWSAQGSWAVLILPPNRLPASVDRERWLKAADELSADGHADAANIARRQVL